MTTYPHRAATEAQAAAYWYAVGWLTACLENEEPVDPAGLLAGMDRMRVQREHEVGEAG